MEMTLIIATLILAAVSYLIGSISFAVIFTNYYAHTDIREHGSGNAGMTNVLRTVGKKPAIFTFICDFLKGVVACLLGKYAMLPILSAILNTDLTSVINPLYFAYLAGLFCIIGHIYPLYFSFKGGKGVATTAGIFLVLDWRVFLIAIALFLVLVLITRTVSIGSIAAAIAIPILTAIFSDKTTEYSFTLFGLPQHIIITIFAVIFAVIVIAKHKENIVRIIHGEEKKFGKKK
ncbi:MAG: glycerol-3-phosphate 1-O-acyltransferase PlsY [Clostridia bacterium]|nr:glycerol-3-phosphate 1-O-acyltransferase PlsY [Clostridia bacterium]